MADLSRLVFSLPAVLESGDDRAADRHELVPVLAVRGLHALLHLALQRVEPRFQLARCARARRASSSSSARIRCTPASETPSLVSSWMRRSSAMSRSE